MKRSINQIVGYSTSLLTKRPLSAFPRSAARDIHKGKSIYSLQSSPIISKKKKYKYIVYTDRTALI
jgi:hypothetical protein